jgi:hypothetical protein
MLLPKLYPDLHLDLSSSLSLLGFLVLCFVLECSVVAQGLAYDIVLGVDWSALFRDSLISSGFRVPDNFDAWTFYSSRLITSLLPTLIGH